MVGALAIGASVGAPTPGHAAPDPAGKTFGGPHHEREIPWPGRFVGVRAGFGTGNALVPRFGFGGESQARAANLQAGAYVGLELGYVRSLRFGRNAMGASIVTEWAFAGLAGPDYLASAPQHLTAAFQLIFLQSERIRINAGVNLLSQYRQVFPSGQTLMSRGFGFRVGGSMLLTRPGAPALEAFATLSADRFTGVEAGFNSKTTSYASGDFIGDKLSSLVLLKLGLQFSLPW